jgi:DNA polymerase
MKSRLHKIEIRNFKAFREFDAGHGPDLYKLAYARSFGIRPEDVTKEQRQIGKVMELALGYQGGVGAFQTMAKGYGVKVEDKEADRLKVAWRTAHPRIKQFWYDLEATAIEAVERPGVLLLAGWGHIAFRKVGSFLFMRLPSGRAICYPYPRVEERGVPWLKKHPTWVACDSIEGARFLYGPDMVRYDEKAQRALVYENDTKKTLIYKGVDVYTRKWGDIQTYGGELANNAVQGAARDILAEAVVRLEDAGYAVILTVHDEVVSEVDEGFGSLDEFQEIMTTLPAWADGLPIAAGGFEARRYRK